MVVAKLAEHELVEVQEFTTTDKTSRKGGLGSTGISDKGGFDGS
jgi:dUTPase